MTDTRCAAAHPEDPTPCDGPPVVTVLDRQNAGADGCEHHATRLLASLEGGKVYPLPDAPEGAAIRVFKAADGTRPFAWIENAPRTQPSQLSREETREWRHHTDGTPVHRYTCTIHDGEECDGHCGPANPVGDAQS